jgi:hypothetical protein
MHSRALKQGKFSRDDCFWQFNTVFVVCLCGSEKEVNDKGL